MITDEYVEVGLNGTNIKHFKSLGYDIPQEKNKRNKLVTKKGTKMIVKVSDLSKGSHVKVRCICDYCNKNTFSIVYKDRASLNKNIDKDCCEECGTLKYLDVMHLLYGVDNTFQLESIKEKSKQTLIKKYGYENYSKTDECKEKVRNTNLKKYGYESSSQCPEIRIKQIEAFYKNGTQKVSSQQLYISELYKGELNYPVRFYNVDISFPIEKLGIEYDGGGHGLSLKLGQITEDEYNRKKLIRSKILKDEGWKIITFISRKDYLPTDEKLLELLSYSRNFFKSNPERSWIEFDFDKQIMRNALCKDGVIYNFGELHRLSNKAV